MSELKLSSDALYRQLSFALVLWFGITAVIVHIVRDDLVLWERNLSIYAVGPAGWLLVTGFYAIGLAQLLIAFRLYQWRRSAGDLLSVFLLTQAALGVMLVAYFPYHIRFPHNLGAAMQLGLFPLFLWLRVFLHRDDPLFKFTAIIATLTTSTFVILVWNGETDYDIGTTSLAQKAEILVNSLWLLVYAWHMPGQHEHRTRSLHQN
ncbi:DUF998 domain-containing protein [Pseudohongiella sp. O18]|uniref:DUF998 domain-containing protein n=1 Tax=Pseudohongiella sp. O18 TaxID=2904248 RepID=UPI001F3AE234|nr:DUF998 domain-containing protein [Pseudohongiella sp. O18]